MDTTRVINIDAVQDAANLFTAADALDGNFVCADENARLIDHPLKAFFGAKDAFYVDEYINAGVAAAHKDIRWAINRARREAVDKHGKYVDEHILLVDLEPNSSSILDGNDEYVYERMMLAFRVLVQREFAACHGDETWENRVLVHERNWPEFAKHYGDDLAKDWPIDDDGYPIPEEA